MEALKERITENGIDYTLIGDYYFPDLKLLEGTAPSDVMGDCTETISKKNTRHGTKVDLEIFVAVASSANFMCCSILKSLSRS